mmetsp:Transcript_21385/g.55896  ORF Transcript_21385/g.55896 Transcript_21385/m.55896 type:complete len:146 (-) Transcript_21385:3-440(-)
MGQLGSREAQAPRADCRQEEAHSAPRQSMDESTAALPKVTTSYGVADKVVTAVAVAAMVCGIISVGGPLYVGHVLAVASVTFPAAFAVPEVVIKAFVGPKPLKVRFWPDHHWVTCALGTGVGFVWGVVLGIKLAHMKGIKFHFKV